MSWISADIGVYEPEGLSWLSQKAWDVEVARVSFVSLLNSADQVTSTLLLAAATKESGMWLHAVPVPSLGTQLDTSVYGLPLHCKLEHQSVSRINVDVAV